MDVTPYDVRYHHSQRYPDDFQSRFLDLEPQFIAWRRELHAVPELSFQEVQTTEFLLKHLRSIPGLTIEQPTKTGVVAVLRGAHPGRTIALRADIDALPIQEETDLPFASKTPGVMHACGHDCHTAMLLGAARILASHREEICGTVKLIFQMAEEIGRKSEEYVKRGALEGVDATFWNACVVQPGRGNRQF